MTVCDHPLVLTAASTTLLLVAASTSCRKHDYRHGVLCILVATVLGFVFFRKPNVVLMQSGLPGILAFGGLGLPFQASFRGFVLLLGSAAALYLTISWHHKRYPYLSFTNVPALVEGEEAMAAENGRMAGGARGLGKKRPYRP